MQNLEKLDNRTMRETIVIPAVPEKQEFLDKTLDDYVIESDNFTRGIEKNEAKKVECDEMIATLTAKKAEIDAKITYARAQGVETYQEEQDRLNTPQFKLKPKSEETLKRA